MGIPSLAPVTISGAFIVGLVLVLLGSLRPLLLKRLQAPEVQVAWLLAALNVTLIPFMLLGGLLIDRVGVRHLFFLGSLVMAVGMYLLAASKNPRQFLAAILVTGAGGACLSNSSSVLMLSAFFPDYPAASQNLGNVFFALGALAAPTLAGQLTGRLDYRRTLTFMAILCLLPALLAVFTQPSAFPPRNGQVQPAMVLDEPILWLCALVFIVYGPLEDSVTIWAPRYLEDVGFSQWRATGLLACFWLSFLAGRLVTALLFGGILTGSLAVGYIVLLGVVAGVVMGNLAGARSRLSAGIGIAVTGFALGPIFPTLAGDLFEHFGAQPGTAFGAMFAAGALGKMLVPPFIAAYSRRRTVRQTMHVPVVLALAVALAATVLALYPHLR
jgi:fucose permease